MIWKYVIVFFAAMAVDIVPFPLPPAFTVMVLCQAVFDLDIWWTIIIGVAGSIVGRLILTLYIPHVSKKIFSRDKNEDIEYLGSKLKNKGWKGHAFVLGYSLMPLPTTPLFLAAGIAKLRPLYIIPAFTVGKFISDAIAVITGDYAIKNLNELLHGITSWKSITGFALGIILILALIFLDWHTLMREKKIHLKFNVWSKKKDKPVKTEPG
jgi:uncharacterized membrane protein YdjX (TVP38/TMEM64 family)